MDMKKILLLAAAAFMAVLSLQAQRMGCLHSSAVTRASEGDMLPSPVVFDPQKTYRQAVVLVSFNDLDFSMADPKDYYHRLFNEQGFNMGAGPGCVADYFREQSGGRTCSSTSTGPSRLTKQQAVMVPIIMATMFLATLSVCCAIAKRPTSPSTTGTVTAG